MRKIICIIVLLFIVIGINTNQIYVQAVDVGPIIGETNKSSPIDGPIAQIGDSALEIITVVGVAIALIMAMFAGMKLMTVAPQERADVKKQLLPFFIGSAFILGAVFFVNLLSNLVTDLFQ